MDSSLPLIGWKEEISSSGDDVIYQTKDPWERNGTESRIMNPVGNISNWRAPETFRMHGSKRAVCAEI